MEAFFHQYYEITLRYRAKQEETRHASREKWEEEERSESLGEAQQALRRDIAALLEAVGTKERVAEIAEGGESRESAWLAYVAARVWQEAEDSNAADQGTRSWSSGRSHRQTALDRFEARWPEAYREARRLFLALPFGEGERIWTWKEAFEALEEESEAFQGTFSQHHQALEALRRMRKIHKRLGAGEQGNRHTKDGESFEVLAGLFAMDEVGETLVRWGGWAAVVSDRVAVNSKQEEAEEQTETETESVEQAETEGVEQTGTGSGEQTETEAEAAKQTESGFSADA
jgi:hypothetical protein